MVAGRRAGPLAHGPLQHQLAATIATERYRCRSMLVHGGATKTEAGNALAPGVSAVPLPALLKNI